MSLLSLPDQIITQVILNLELKDLLALGDSHSRLRDLVYKTPEIWTSDMLFPVGDSRITDKFTQRIVPRITRHYGILSLKMIHLPLTWIGYFMIFDQFAHSVKRIQIDTPSANLEHLVHHLGVFAGNLAMLQRSNRIPITFRQYAFDHEEHATELANSTNYLGQSTLHNLINQMAHMNLDDPPFERLELFNVDVKQGDQHLVEQLGLLTGFLSGRTTTDPVIHSPIPNTVLNSKRQRADEPTQPTNKYQRHETSPHRQDKHYPYQLHQQQPQDHKQQQQQQHQQQHRMERPFSV
ncbi:hypothetical protein [Parasitella parasitica]|uniref:F-box domain-containing protein n=1 Tax=Parasitella parasitica TaxID=35722 RepID=A0A0B7N8B6_9FUNG|nr:hypothetical protein [Parasitella parasitica]